MDVYMDDMVDIGGCSLIVGLMDVDILSEWWIYEDDALIWPLCDRVMLQYGTHTQLTVTDAVVWCSKTI